MKNLYIVLALILISLKVESQALGFVYEQSSNKEKIPIVGASVYWQGTNISTITFDDGSFLIDESNIPESRLMVSFVGYEIDEQDFDEGQYIFYLNKNTELSQIDVNANKSTTIVSTLKSLNTQVLSNSELQKAACCNLSESFSTNTTVDVLYSDAVSGLKKIQMLGLDGAYVQINNESMPLIRGLQRSYGLTYVPGSWINSIQITKGMASVVNGHESITGQINVEYFYPENADKVFWNFYISNHGKIENNLIFSKKSGNWKSNLFTHASYFDKEEDSYGGDVNSSIDQNSGDGFLDMPKFKQFSFLNRWKYYGSDDFAFQINFKGLAEERISGQKQDILNPYLAKINNNLFNIYSKIGTTFSETKSYALQSSFLLHEKDALFGNNLYKGVQKTIYLNFISDNYFNKKNLLRYGLSYNLDNYDEIFIGNGYGFDRDLYKYTSGVFLEHTFTSNEYLKIISGVRADYYNKTNKLYYSPRFNLRYNPTENTAVRLAMGQGFRIAEPIVENMNFLNSSRELKIQQNILPEEAVNFGLNIIHCFYLFNKEGTINLDIYRTDFKNQLVIDIENQDFLSFYNLDGKSYSNTIQFEFDYELINGLQARLGYKLSESVSTFDGVEKQIPLMPSYRILFNISYTTINNNWIFDYTVNRIGSSRIPENSYINEDSSRPFNLHNTNITRKFKNFDFYLGAENILNYVQKNPIIDGNNWSDNNSDFDASMIYAPTSGLNLYSGIRYKIN